RIPQKDPDEEESTPSQWHITVNPSANFLSSSEQLKSLVNRLYRTQKLISPSEARYLSTALQCLDTTSDLLLPLLTVISNATAFPSNQIMLVQCIANMAVSNENAAILQKSIPQLVKRLDSHLELESTVAFQALTNLSLNISSTQIDLFLPAISICFKRLWVKGEANLNALRLLVNLSCCPDMVPHILAAKAVTGLLSVLDSDKPEVVLRTVIWLLCMSSAVEALCISYDLIAPLNKDPFANPHYTVYFAIYAAKGRKELEKRLTELSSGEGELATKSKRLLETLARIPEARSCVSHLNRL
uniref:Arm_2 domain-containing protein n=1 Tax=Ascaris lumbricoides TaxID=6252 RepID=A0A0M3IG15_ASCLU